MKWLVTGGCGFIGANLIRRLYNEGTHGVRVLDNLSVGSIQDLGDVVPYQIAGSPPERFPEPGAAVQVLISDITNRNHVSAAARSAEVIVHLAANTGVIPSVQDPLSDCHTNVVGTLQLLEAARLSGVQRFILASSGAVLGEQVPPLHEEKFPKPLSPYGASKLSCEAYCAVYHALFGLTTVVLRFSNAYGPGSARKGSAITRFIQQAIAGECLVIYGDGNQTRDFLYVDDLVDAICLAVRLKDDVQLFHIATNCETTVNEIVAVLGRLLRELAGRSLDIEHVDTRPGEVRRNYSDISKAKDILKWSPRHTVEEGLRKTLGWFLESHRYHGPQS